MLSWCTFRDVVKVERYQHTKSMEGRYLKAYGSESTLPEQMTRSLADDIGIGHRSYSCSGNKAFTLSCARVRDVALHGVSWHPVAAYVNTWLHCDLLEVQFPFVLEIAQWWLPCVFCDVCRQPPWIEDLLWLWPSTPLDLRLCTSRHTSLM